MRSTEDPPLVVLLGPTAVGKTEIGIELAERLGMEIVSADSRLLYRGMDIGTAKPNAAQRARVRHHLIDVADPDETWSLARFQRAAKEAFSAIHQQSKLPLLVGGTGQYLRAILEGWLPPALNPFPNMRAALEDWAGQIGKEALHAGLTRQDPVAAAKIDSRNLRRTLRALEVIFTTGRLFSEQRGRVGAPERNLQIGLKRPRSELYARADARIQAMLEAGWLDEVQALLSKGYSPELPSLSAIGYQQLIRHLQGELALDEAVVLIKRATRVFARRQANWFKSDDPEIQWFSAGEENVVADIEARVRDFLE